MKLVEIILLQQPKVDVIWRSWSRSFYFRNPKLTSICLMKLAEIILLQKPKVDVIWWNWSRSFYFSNPKLTSFCLMKLAEIILLQKPKVDVVWRSWSRSVYFSNPKLTSFCLKKLVELILLQQPKVDIILFDETGGDHFTSATPSWRHFIWRSWSRSFYFRNPKLTSFCLKKLAQIILLQQSKVDVILFDETGRDHFTSATQSWRHFVWRSWSR